MDQQETPEPGPLLPPASRGLRWAIRGRFVLLGCYLLLCLFWYYMLLSSSDPLGLSVAISGGYSFIACVLFTLFLFGLQFLLLLGAPQVRWPRPRHRRSMFISLAAGSAIALLLSVGVYFAGESLYRLIYDPVALKAQWSFATTMPTTAVAIPATPAAPISWSEQVPWTPIGIGVVGWSLWFLIFSLVGTGQWSQRFRWMYRSLIAGTVLELLITIPIDAQLRKKTDCYCGQGTFLSLIIGLTAILWTFGPGVAILFFIRRNQRIAGTGCCLTCGYDLRASKVRCPECGTPISFRTTVTPDSGVAARLQ